MTNITGEVVFMDVTYPSLEHAFQASRFVEQALRDKIRRAPTPRAAIAQARLWPTSMPDWNDCSAMIRRTLMEQLTEELDELI